MAPAPCDARFARSGMVCAADHLAAQAGVSLLHIGGTAADAAVAASAVLAVTCQHMCGMGGDLFALVHEPGMAAPVVLNASGRSGSGADADRMREEGHRDMPLTGDIRSVPVPGCVDGWLALHGRYGALPLADVLAPAIGYAEDGFPASPLLAYTASIVAELPGGHDFRSATHPGAIVRRPGAARALRDIVGGGRDGYYQGEFGQGLLALGAGEYHPDDLAVPNADWVTALSADAWGHRIWTVPPNSQGYLTLAGAWIAAGLPLPAEADDPLWAHLTIEAARQAAFDREEALHDGADVGALLEPGRLKARRAAIDPYRAAVLGDAYRDGGTTYLCAVDDQRRGVSLIQSNALGFGALIAEPSTGIFLHDRGLGFSLVPGHPAEYGPRRRPPHTLSPALVTRPDGSLRMVIGTMGGDSQPQILLQLLARLLHGGAAAGDAIGAGRWVLEGDRDRGGGFRTWRRRGLVRVALEPGGPSGWPSGLEAHGHQVAVTPGNYGHAHVIINHGDHLEGASDPRALAGGALGY